VVDWRERQKKASNDNRANPHESSAHNQTPKDVGTQFAHSQIFSIPSPANEIQGAARTGQSERSEVIVRDWTP
jgi:hypothetical protein